MIEESGYQKNEYSGNAIAGAASPNSDAYSSLVLEKSAIRSNL